MSHSIPLVGNPIKVNDPIPRFNQRSQSTIILILVNAIDTLLLNGTNTGRKATAQHGEGSKINLGIPMGVGEVLFDG